MFLVVEVSHLQGDLKNKNIRQKNITGAGTVRHATPAQFCTIMSKAAQNVNNMKIKRKNGDLVSVVRRSWEVSSYIPDAYLGHQLKKVMAFDLSHIPYGQAGTLLKEFREKNKAEKKAAADSKKQKKKQEEIALRNALAAKKKAEAEKKRAEKKVALKAAKAKKKADLIAKKATRAESASTDSVSVSSKSSDVSTATRNNPETENAPVSNCGAAETSPAKSSNVPTRQPFTKTPYLPRASSFPSTTSSSSTVPAKSAHPVDDEMDLSDLFVPLVPNSVPTPLATSAIPPPPIDQSTFSPTPRSVPTFSPLSLIPPSFSSAHRGLPTPSYAHTLQCSTVSSQTPLTPLASSSTFLSVSPAHVYSAVPTNRSSHVSLGSVVTVAARNGSSATLPRHASASAAQISHTIPSVSHASNCAARLPSTAQKHGFGGRVSTSKPWPPQTDARTKGVILLSCFLIFKNDIYTKVTT